MEGHIGRHKHVNSERSSIPTQTDSQSYYYITVAIDSSFFGHMSHDAFSFSVQIPTVNVGQLCNYCGSCSTFSLYYTHCCYNAVCCKPYYSEQQYSLLWERQGQACGGFLFYLCRLFTLCVNFCSLPVVIHSKKWIQTNFIFSAWSLLSQRPGQYCVLIYTGIVIVQRVPQ